MAEQTSSPTETTPPSPRTDGRKRAGLLISAVVAVLIVTGGWFLFGRGTPDPVDIDTAASGVTTTIAEGSSSSGDTSVEDLTGTWTVDTSTGEFDFDSATGTFAGFRIDEELAGVGATEAVGRTGDVSGTFTLDGTTITDAEFEVDMSTITTDESMRDNKVQDALATDTYPTATFRLTEPIELSDDAASGATTEVTAVGELTIHGVTNEVSVPLQARLVDDTVVVVGSVDIAFEDYGVQVPSSMKVVSVEDHGTIEFQLLLTR